MGSDEQEMRAGPFEINERRSSWRVWSLKKKKNKERWEGEGEERRGGKRK